MSSEYRGVSRQPLSMVYITNMLSHHQLPTSRELAGLLGESNFTLAATEPVHEERAAMGWQSQGFDEPWILRAYESDTERERLDTLLRECDVAVIGCRDAAMIGPRVATGKLTFMMSERWFKPPLGKFRLLHPRFAAMVSQFRGIAANSNFHYLAMGHYAAPDIAFVRSIRTRMWRWGYFIQPGCGPVNRSNDVARIMWAGRMLGWKRVSVLLAAAKRLRDAGHAFQMDLIGDGPERGSLLEQRDRCGLQNEVSFHRSMTAVEVRKRMRESDIYVLPSSGAEGWGAVVNEAMAEGCLVIACREAGSARVLIRDGVNGLLFRLDDDRRLADLLARALTDERWRSKLAVEGQRSISDLWCPSVAAERLVRLSEALMDRSERPGYAEGPCSAILA